MAAFADGGRAAWLRASLAGFASLVSWKLVQIAVAHRQKQEAERGRTQSEAMSRLLFGVRNCVERQFGRVRDVVARIGPTQRAIGHVRDALPPQAHLDELLAQLGTVLRRDRLAKNVRVGLYVNVGGVMSPVNGIDLGKPGYSPFDAFRSHPDFFRLAGTRASHVVRCVREKRTILVPDCCRSALAGEFYFSRPEQEEYLKSLVVCYLGDVYTGSGMAEAALSIDANESNFFTTGEFDSLELIIKEFGLRIRFEMCLRTLLDRQEGAT